MPQSGSITRHGFWNDDEKSSQLESILQNVYSLPKINKSLFKCAPIKPILNENKIKNEMSVKRNYSTQFNIEAVKLYSPLKSPSGFQKVNMKEYQSLKPNNQKKREEPIINNLMETINPYK